MQSRNRSAIISFSQQLHSFQQMTKFDHCRRLMQLVNVACFCRDSFKEQINGTEDVDDAMNENVSGRQ